MQFQCFILHCAYINRVHAGIGHYVLDIRSLRFATDKILWRCIATAAAAMFSFFSCQSLSSSRLCTQRMCSLCSRVIIMSMWIGWWPMCDCVSWRCGKCTYTHWTKNAIEIKSSVRSLFLALDNLDRWGGRKIRPNMTRQQQQQQNPTANTVAHTKKHTINDCLYDTGYFSEMYSHKPFNLSVRRPLFQSEQPKGIAKRPISSVHLAKRARSLSLTFSFSVEMETSTATTTMAISIDRYVMCDWVYYAENTKCTFMKVEKTHTHIHCH